MPQTVEVRFKGTRRAFFHWTHDDTQPLRLQESVIVGAERGEDLGRVSAVGDVAAKKCGGSCSVPSVQSGEAAGNGGGCGPALPASTNGTDAVKEFPAVIRRASQEDVRRSNELRRAEEEDRKRIVAKVREHRLEMKVSDVEWQWDRHQMTVYFSAEQRVDFRALVRELASTFRTRIDLRQIGVRDEAARLSGVGRCGREYCCSTWLTELSPVNLSLAKNQSLSLNPSQISGGCGRLLCCLKYEHEFYAAARKRFPREGKSVATLRGTEKVIAIDIFRERVYLRGMEESRTVGLEELREEMEAAASGTAPVVVPTPRAERPARPARSERPARTEGAPSDQRTPANEPRSESRPDRPRREQRQGDRPRPEQRQGERRPEAQPSRPEATETPAAQPPAEGAAGPARRKRRRRRRRGGGRGGESGGSPAPEGPA